tara:strand:- start:6839 stop:7225 length:387 start_codon:yes stop_codon:yes gene_type:complete
VKKKPDNVVFNEKTSEFDAKNKLYPTNVGAPSFKPVVIDNTSSIKATKYFKTKLSEIEKDYKKLLDDYKNTTLIYESDYNFEPIMGEVYHLYEKKNSRFLSLIAPNEWNKKYLGSYLLTTDGKWEKVN